MKTPHRTPHLACLGRGKQQNRVGKKGFMDMIFVMIFLLIISIVIVTAYMLLTTITPQLTATLGNNASTEVLNIGDTAMKGFDYGFLGILVGLTLYTIISGFFVGSHPIFFWAGVLFMGILTYISAAISNSYEKFVLDSVVAGAAANFTITNYIMLNLPMFMAVMTAIVIIVFVAKPFGIGGQGSNQI